MTWKEHALKAIQDLPDDAMVGDATERLCLLLKVERGLAQADAGQKMSQEEACQHMAHWVK